MVDKDCQLSLSIFTFSILKPMTARPNNNRIKLSLFILTSRILKPDGLTESILISSLSLFILTFCILKRHLSSLIDRHMFFHYQFSQHIH